MALLPSIFNVPTFESTIFDDYSNSMKKADRYMREMEHQICDKNRRLNMTMPVDMRSHEAEAWHLENPVVTDSEGNRNLRVRFDVRQFKPEEIHLKTNKGNLEVRAKHEESTGTSKVYREYLRIFALPEGVNIDTMKSTLNRDGVLVIEAPLPALKDEPKEYQLKIEHVK